MTKTRAFTLLEILVVVAIIGLLMSITVPTVASARRSGQSAKCRANLHGIGEAMEAYFSTHNDVFPCVAQLPSAERNVTDREAYDAMPVVLKKEMNATAVKEEDPATNKPKEKVWHEVFECPSDIIRSEDSSLAALGLFVGHRYFDTETTSYEWNGFLNPDYDDQLGRYLPQKRRQAKGTQVISGLLRRSLSRLEMVYEFEVFHAGANGEGPWNCLYADGHVYAK